MSVSREELYQLVWTQPMTKVAEQFGVSGSYLARVCVLMNVPRPERGYWAKLQVGKAPPQEPLPEAQPGDQLHWSRDDSVLAPQRPRPAFKRPRKTKIHVPQGKIHRLILGAKPLFEKTRRIEEGEYLRPYKRLLVDVTSSEACLTKALDFANNLFNALESAGHRVVIPPSSEKLQRASIEVRENPVKKQYDHYNHGFWSPDRPTVVYGGRVPIGLCIVEMSESVLLRYVRGKYIRESEYVPPKSSRYYTEHTWTTTKDLPSGRLRLIAYAPYYRVDWTTSWQETKKVSLTSSVKPVVRALENASGELVTLLDEADRKAEEERQAWIAQQEKWRREEDEKKVQQSVAESRQQLESIIQQWSYVKSIEQFLVGVEESLNELLEEEREKVAERLRLAREFLGSQNPLDFLLAWKTPQEIYEPKYPKD